MKNLYSTVIAAMLLLSMLFTVSYAEESVIFKEPKADVSTGIGIKAVKERLIASDVTSTKPFWCGPAHMLAYSKDDGGLLLQNVDTGKVITVSDDPYNRMVGCTNDGQWFVYYDVNAYHKGDDENPEYGNEMVRYEVATGRREAFAVAYSERAFFSPLDDSIYLAGPHPVKIEMPEPKWDIIWSGSEYSGMLRLGKPPVVLSGGNRKLFVDVLEPERRSLELKMPDSGSSATLLLVDAQNRFYIEVLLDNLHIYIRCTLDLEKENVECDVIPKARIYDSNFDTLKNGKSVIIQSRFNNYLLEKNVENKEHHHIVELSHVVDRYLLISPDESMVAFDIDRSRSDGTTANDLYVIDLPKSR